MARKFNTTAVCVPSKHYMVDLSERVAQIKEMVDAGEYFAINRARQYGKTTNLYALRGPLLADYDVVSLDFQRIGNAGFKTEQSFVRAFCRRLKRARGRGSCSTRSRTTSPACRCTASFATKAASLG